MVPLATDIITAELTGRPSPISDLKEQVIPYYGVKEAVFPFNMFQEVDPVLGPEMRSTGEVLGLSRFYGEAFYKAQEAAGSFLPCWGTVLISVNKRDIKEAVEIARKFDVLGFKIMATGNTYDNIVASGIPAQKVNKLNEGRPNIHDFITNGDIQLIVNSPVGKDSVNDDSYLRKDAIKAKVPYITTMAGAMASVEGIGTMRTGIVIQVKSLQELHKEIHDA
jgi:carbamoyl-phosphate synthase large subunit